MTTVIQLRFSNNSLAPFYKVCCQPCDLELFIRGKPLAERLALTHDCRLRRNDLRRLYGRANLPPPVEDERQTSLFDPYS